jgi:hypothetical protein
MPDESTAIASKSELLLELIALELAYARLNGVEHVTSEDRSRSKQLLSVKPFHDLFSTFFTDLNFDELVY